MKEKNKCPCCNKAGEWEILEYPIKNEHILVSSIQSYRTTHPKYIESSYLITDPWLTRFEIELQTFDDYQCKKKITPNLHNEENKLVQMLSIEHKHNSNSLLNHISTMLGLSCFDYIDNLLNSKIDGFRINWLTEVEMVNGTDKRILFHFQILTSVQMEIEPIKLVEHINNVNCNYMSEKYCYMKFALTEMDKQTKVSSLNEVFEIKGTNMKENNEQTETLSLMMLNFCPKMYSVSNITTTDNIWLWSEENYVGNKEIVGRFEETNEHLHELVEPYIYIPEQDRKESKKN